MHGNLPDSLAIASLIRSITLQSIINLYRVLRTAVDEGRLGALNNLRLKVLRRCFDNRAGLWVPLSAFHELDVGVTVGCSTVR